MNPKAERKVYEGRIFGRCREECQVLNDIARQSVRSGGREMS